MKPKDGLFAACRRFAGLYLLCLMLLGGGKAMASDEFAATPPHVMEPAEVRTVKGTVTDKVTRLPVVGASVWLKDTSIGVITDADGSFSINVPGAGGVVAVSFLGYETAELEIKGRTQLNFVLEPGSEVVDEVVVVGYGVQRKESVVGSIASVKGSDLQLPVANVSSSLAGQLAGIVSVQRSGEPGSASNFWIRGMSSFNPSETGANSTANAPLVLVDGIERTIDLVDPEDIESLSVLKDAAATAIYGVRGANGVIIIKTRSGETGAAKVAIRAEAGLVTPTKMPEMVNAFEFIDLYNEAYGYRTNGDLYYKADMVEKYRTGADPDLYPNVNWIDELFKSVAWNQRVNANVSGGGSIARYYVSGSFYNESSIYKTDNMNSYDTSINYNKFNFRSNIDINLAPSTVLNVNLSNIYETKVSPTADDIWSRAFYTSPNVIPVKYSDGTLSANQNAVNPYNLLTQSGYKNQYWNNAQAVVGLTQDFGNSITKGLKANVKFSWDVVTAQTQRYSGSANTFFATGRDEEGNLQFQEVNKGSNTLDYSKDSSGSKTFYLEGSITYDRVFGKHRVGALFLYNHKSQRYMLAPDKDRSLPYRNQGIAGRATYSFDDRYFAEFNFGYNGSENFSPGRRFGFFPSVALGWMISNEKFFEPLRDVVDALKIKGSYGVVGNDKIGGSRRFIYDAVYGTQGNVYQFGTNGAYVNAIYLQELGNPNVSWEKSYKLNLGVELSLFNSIRLTADYFKDHRKGIFLRRDDMSSLFGMESNPYANVGEGINRGVDMSLDVTRTFGKLKLSLRGNFTFNRSEMTNDAKPKWNYAYREWKGRPIEQQMGLIAEGLFTSQEEIDNSPKQEYGPVRVGDIRYRDLNGDGVINKNDITSIGRSRIPEIVYGFGASVQWHNFDLSFLFQGVGNVTMQLSGYAMHPFSANQIASAGFFRDVYKNSWRLDNQNPNAEFPRNDTQSNTNNEQASTFWQRDASYLRLKNATIGYTFPRTVTRKIRIENLRLYMSGVNLLTFSKFKMFDPELGDGMGAGYPPTTVVNFGINFNF
ncbi:SusC/RagA family TonB-linked outer membrane protein [Alistipes finegoldii]|uniref:SusC/RagA family TonB-linked outer membrane protein n=1 Tax=Alistipes finegoldii TaxID=214856 RepID=UPI0026654E50|nr:TonB-dependent receptor [Alistipes finegoldii]